MYSTQAGLVPGLVHYKPVSIRVASAVNLPVIRPKDACECHNRKDASVYRSYVGRHSYRSSKMSAGNGVSIRRREPSCREIWAWETGETKALKRNGRWKVGRVCKAWIRVKLCLARSHGRLGTMRERTLQ